MADSPKDVKKKEEAIKKAAVHALPTFLQSLGLDTSKEMKCIDCGKNDMHLTPDGSAVYCDSCGWQSDLYWTIAKAIHNRKNKRFFKPSASEHRNIIERICQLAHIDFDSFAIPEPKAQINAQLSFTEPVEDSQLATDNPPKSIFAALDKFKSKPEDGYKNVAVYHIDDTHSIIGVNPNSERTDKMTEPIRNTSTDERRKVPVRDRAALDAAKKELRRYLDSMGHSPNASGMINCINPSHTDDKPSMKFFADTNKLYCFACGWHGDLVDAIKELEGLDDKAAINRAIEFAGTEHLLPSKKKQHIDKDKADRVKLERIKSNIITWHQILLSNSASSRDAIDYLHTRGFNDDDLQSLIETFKIGYNPITHCLIIPHGHQPDGLDYYTARNILPDCPKENRFRHNAAAPVQLFNPDALNHDFVFITEGAIDALSIIACGFYAIATGGAQGKKPLFTALKKLDAQNKHLPTFIIGFDNDVNHAGEDAAKQLAYALNNDDEKDKSKFHILSNIALPPNGFHDFNDAFKADRHALTEYLQLQVDKVKDAKLNPQHQTPFGDAVNDDPRLNYPTDSVILPNETSDIAIAQYILDSSPDLIRYNFDAAKFMLYQPPLWHTLNKDAELRSFVNDFRLRISSSEHRIDKRISSKLTKSKNVDGVVKMFYSFANIRIGNDDINNHPWLLPCKNGVVDLTTGELFDHNGKFLWTKIADFNFDPDAPRSIFRSFIEQIIPDVDTRIALQSFLGYSLTASVEEEKALFVYGSGGNGKGTLFGAISRCLGDFVTPLKIDCLLAGGRSVDAQAASPEFNKLLHRRLAIAEEVPKNRKLDSAQFKLLTGGDQLPIRLLHHESTTIKNPCHKIILSGNQLPDLSDPNDEGLKRRLMVLHFPASFTDTNRDPKLKAKLAQPAVQSDIFNWLLEGCLIWQQDGLKVSEQMQLERDRYLSANDLIADFVDEHCELGEGKSVSRKALIEHVKMFGDRDLRTMHDKKLIDAFLHAFPDDIRYEKTMVGRVLFGIGIRVPDGSSNK